MSSKTVKNGTCQQFLPATGVMNELRIVLLGKTGVGKSSCGNAILFQNVFLYEASPNSVTKKCESSTKIINERQVTVVDNPELFNINLSQNEANSEILQCITECAPGPHAFIIVFRVDRYTKHEMETVKEITDTFEEEALKHVNRAVEAQIVIMRRERNEELIDMNTMRAQARQTVYEKLLENLGPLGLAARVGAFLGFSIGVKAVTYVALKLRN